MNKGTPLARPSEILTLVGLEKSTKAHNLRLRKAAMRQLRHTYDTVVQPQISEPSDGMQAHSKKILSYASCGN